MTCQDRIETLPQERRGLMNLTKDAKEIIRTLGQNRFYA